MLGKEIFGKGKRLTPNSFFSNNTIELFKSDPKTLTDSELPVVTNFSGLTKTQRRKFKNWAFDPNWTRIRMEAAQKMLFEKMNDVELADKTSLMNEIMESLSTTTIPASQTHFQIPALPKRANVGGSIDEKFMSQVTREKEDVTRMGSESQNSSTGVGKDDFSWAELADDDADDALIEDLSKFDDINLKDDQDLVPEQETREREEKVDLGDSQRKEKNLSSEKKKWFNLSPKGSFKNRGSYSGNIGGHRYKPKSKSLSPSHPSHKVSPIYEDHREARRVIGDMFHAMNVNLSREFLDDLMYHFNMHGYLSEDMIFMYIQGIQKERQTSLFKRQENLVTKLMETAAAYGKHLENLKSNIAVVQQMGDLAIVKKSDSYKAKESRGRSKSRTRAQLTCNTEEEGFKSGFSEVINPVPVFVAPVATSSSKTRQWRPVTKPQMEKKDSESSDGGRSLDKGKEPYDPKKDESKKTTVPNKLMKDSMKASGAFFEKSKMSEEKVSSSILTKNEEELIFHGMDDAQLIVKAMMHIAAPPELKDPDLMIKLMDLLGRDIWVEILMTKDSRKKRDFITELAEISIDLMDD
ncbi:TPA_asm: P [Zanthoxylum betacytorhabdovirus 2]|nr:TPA_asm: P [Zanthoxilum betacytorhabdovirus 2]